MKLIIAYIRPEKLGEVKDALQEREVGKLSVTNSVGCGQQGGYEENYRGVKKEINLLKKVRIEIAVNDEFVDKVIEGIMSVAKTGSPGDGKILIIPLEEVIRIRTDEKGNKAV